MTNFFLVKKSGKDIYYLKHCKIYIIDLWFMSEEIKNCLKYTYKIPSPTLSNPWMKCLRILFSSNCERSRKNFVSINE